MPGEHGNDGVRFFTPRGRPWSRDHRQLRHHHRYVLDKVRVGKAGERVEHLHLEAQRPQCIGIRAVLDQHAGGIRLAQTGGGEASREVRPWPSQDSASQHGPEVTAT